MAYVEEQRFWDKARLLVTDACNYRCAFCHNEGQHAKQQHSFMTMEDAALIVDALRDSVTTEIQFSGGEPFLNRDIVEMILYANANTACDIGCASNLSMVTEAQLEALKSTRVKFNVQFPFVEQALFSKSTGGGDFDQIVSTIELARELGIEVGLNSVIQKNGVDKVEDMIVFALERELPLKLLPQVGLDESIRYKEGVFPVIEKYATSVLDKGTGAIRWTIEGLGHTTSVLYIDSPCFSRDFSRCKKYGEVRIMPNMVASTCLLNPDESISLDTRHGSAHVRKQLEELWKSFNRCS